jgi:hypothetical protein
VSSAASVFVDQVVGCAAHFCVELRWMHLDFADDVSNWQRIPHNHPVAHTADTSRVTRGP